MWFQHTGELHRFYASDVIHAAVASEPASVANEDAVQVLPSRLFGTVLRTRAGRATVRMWGASDDGRSFFIDVALTDLRKIVRAP